MKTVTVTKIASSIEIIDLSSCDWSDQESCIALANLIAQSKNLKKVFLNYQQGNEKIKVKLTDN